MSHLFDLSAWVSLMAEQIHETLDVMQGRLTGDNPNAHFDEMVYHELEGIYLELTTDNSAQTKGELFVYTMSKWGKVLVAHYTGANQQRKLNESKYMPVDDTSLAEYAQIEAFFINVHFMSLIRGQSLFFDERADIMKDIIEGLDDAKTRIPTSALYWKRDLSRVRYFLEQVLEKAVFDPYSSLPKQVFGQHQFSREDYPEPVDDTGESAGGGGGMLLLLGAGALLLFYLNK